MFGRNLAIFWIDVNAYGTAAKYLSGYQCAAYAHIGIKDTTRRARQLRNPRHQQRVLLTKVRFWKHGL